jgi:hypothetical protein
VLVIAASGRSFDEWARQRAQAIEQQRKPQPTKTVWAIGSMEWFAEQDKALETERRLGTGS